MLRLVVVSANLNFPPSTRKTEPDSFVLATFRGVKRQTSVLRKNPRPFWNETLEWYLGEMPLNSTSAIEVEVRDAGKIAKDRLFGYSMVYLKPLALNLNEPMSLTEQFLLDSNHQPTKFTITVKIFYLSLVEAESVYQAQSNKGTWENAGEHKDDTLMARNRLTDRKYEFQVRVMIIKGRQLQANNLRSVVRVNVGEKVFHTRRRLGNNPIYNEIFFFNFYQSPSVLFDETLNIQVLNTEARRSHAIIGVFRLELGTVYNARGHVLLSKWLTLYDPDNVSLGVRGYLMVSLYVLGAGDKVPVEAEDAADKEDVESNLLNADSVPVRMATISLWIYQAEDLPQMDENFTSGFGHIFKSAANKKNFVDPYVEVTFGGKLLKTKVSPKNPNPEWNQLLSFPIQVPSMCEKLKLTVMDWDALSKDDPIGTTFLRLSQVSCSCAEIEKGFSGFLPCFGPCFLTLYGSPRESKGTALDDELNRGTGEGVAYRGRVLVQLETIMEDILKPKVLDQPRELLQRVERVLHRRKYGLCAVFYSATMLPEVKELIQFEVSIGNYGNKFDVSCKPQASTTQYSEAVYDGNFYYYLPWYNTLPVVAIICFWEGITERMDILNILLSVQEKLESILRLLTVTANVTRNSQKSTILRLLQELYDICRQPLPSLKRQDSTSLDKQLWTLRRLFLKQVASIVGNLQRDGGADKSALLPEVQNTLQDMLQMITCAAQEPQISLPDVIIWMLYKEERVAYARVKAHSILFSSFSPNACGKFCGKTQTLFLKYLHSKSHQHTLPVQLRIRLWLGLMSDRQQINKYIEGKMSVYAEMYENQVKSSGSWGSKGLGKHPSFSDISGKFSIPKDSFQLPDGWKWNSDWTVEPQKRLLLDKEINHNEVVEELYENETRVAGIGWVPAEVPNTSVTGEKRLNKEDLKCPSGWHFKDDWTVEMNRAVDESGWEYGVSLSSTGIPKSWSASEKTYHTYRRRHWIRKRYRIQSEKSHDTRTASFLNLHPADVTSDVANRPVGALEHSSSWVFASNIGWKFHLRQHTRDMYRRRCWRRALTPTEDMGMEAMFFLEGSMGVETEWQEQQKNVSKRPPAHDILQINTPIIYCQFDRPNYYQLRCYIFHARNLRTTERKNFLNAFAHVSFLHVSQQTNVCRGTQNPRWDQTLLFHDVLIYGNRQSIMEDPPYVTMELFDKDIYGKNTFLGRTFCLPVVCQDIILRIPPQLAWYPVKKEHKSVGEVLAAFELLFDDKAGNLDSIPTLPLVENEKYIVPEGIRPTLRYMAIEILAWGVRRLKSYELLRVSSPSLLVQCGEESIQSLPIQNYHKNPNFTDSVLFMKTYLPVEEAYTPPLVLKLLDNRPFGYKPIVGKTSLTSLQQYYCDPNKGIPGPVLPIRVSGMNLKAELSKKYFKDMMIPKRAHQTAAGSKKKEEEIFDWWSKFYSSIGDESQSINYLRAGYDRITVYHTALEEVPIFEGLEDFCQTFTLYRGQIEDDDDDDIEKSEAMMVGQFKGLFRIYPISEDPEDPLPPRQFQDLPASYPQECLVRVYIIRALNLQPKDLNGLCDPYIRISLGKKKVGDRYQYIPATLSPVFGRMYELSCVIPKKKDLKISVYDFDLIQQDQLIGETELDLENRLLSRFGAYCGLPRTYCISGPNPWRDQMSPRMLLEQYTMMKNWPEPLFSADGHMVTVRGIQYLLSDMEIAAPKHGHLGPPAERLALHVLRMQRHVPEHVETRSLYSKFQPGIEQGKLQMWVDIFPKSLGPPGPAFNITPRIPENYELRVIIWNTEDVDLQETSVIGQRMSDIYVKGWMDGLEDNSQRTDVHYRSLEGEGNFNWRFIFPFSYLPIEQKCILKEKDHFWRLDETIRKIPPKLIIQIWDNDIFSPDDFLGALELNLSRLLRPAKLPEHCTLRKVFHASKTADLFSQKEVRGWWPCTTVENGWLRTSGKVEMTLQILTEKESEEHPAGKGRNEPNMNPILEPPKRPETSFLWFRNPWRTCRFLIWKRYRCWIISILILMLLLLLLGIFIYSFPNYLAEKLLNLNSVLNPHRTGKESSGSSFINARHIPINPHVAMHANTPNDPHVSSSTTIRDLPDFPTNHIPTYPLAFNDYQLTSPHLSTRPAITTKSPIITVPTFTTSSNIPSNPPFSNKFLPFFMSSETTNMQVETNPPITKISAKSPNAANDPVFIFLPASPNTQPSPSLPITINPTITPNLPITTSPSVTNILSIYASVSDSSQSSQEPHTAYQFKISQESQVYHNPYDSLLPVTSATSISSGLLRPPQYFIPLHTAPHQHTDPHNFPTEYGTCALSAFQDTSATTPNTDSGIPSASTTTSTTLYASNTDSTSPTTSTIISTTTDTPALTFPNISTDHPTTSSSALTNLIISLQRSYATPSKSDSESHPIISTSPSSETSPNNDALLSSPDSLSYEALSILTLPSYEKPSRIFAPPEYQTISSILERPIYKTHPSSFLSSYKMSSINDISPSNPTQSSNSAPVSCEMQPFITLPNAGILLSIVVDPSYESPHFSMVTPPYLSTPIYESTTSIDTPFSNVPSSTIPTSTSSSPSPSFTATSAVPSRTILTLSSSGSSTSVAASPTVPSRTISILSSSSSSTSVTITAAVPARTNPTLSSSSSSASITATPTVPSHTIPTSTSSGPPPSITASSTVPSSTIPTSTSSGHPPSIFATSTVPSPTIPTSTSSGSSPSFTATPPVPSRTIPTLSSSSSSTSDTASPTVLSLTIPTSTSSGSPPIITATSTVPSTTIPTSTSSGSSPSFSAATAVPSRTIPTLSSSGSSTSVTAAPIVSSLTIPSSTSSAPPSSITASSTVLSPTILTSTSSGRPPKVFATSTVSLPTIPTSTSSRSLPSFTAAPTVPPLTIPTSTSFGHPPSITATSTVLSPTIPTSTSSGHPPRDFATSTATSLTISTSTSSGLPPNGTASFMVPSTTIPTSIGFSPSPSITTDSTIPSPTIPTPTTSSYPPSVSATHTVAYPMIPTLTSSSTSTTVTSTPRVSSPTVPTSAGSGPPPNGTASFMVPSTTIPTSTSSSPSPSITSASTIPSPTLPTSTTSSPPSVSATPKVPYPMIPTSTSSSTSTSVTSVPTVSSPTSPTSTSSSPPPSSTASFMVPAATIDTSTSSGSPPIVTTTSTVPSPTIPTAKSSGPSPSLIAAPTVPSPTISTSASSDPLSSVTASSTSYQRSNIL